MCQSPTTATSGQAIHTPYSNQWTIPPRPITKTEFDLTETPVATTTTITTTTSSPTVTINDRLGTKRGRLRSSSCGSGGSDGGTGYTASGVQCAFCKRNGETREFYSTHILKDWRGMVVCPVLRAYTCPRCGASGDHAHTESHCPLSGNEPSLMATLRTQRRSCGKKAYNWKP
ncbi:hypothetical protein ACOMHN_027171 [Nucella lapillus]